MTYRDPSRYPYVRDPQGHIWKEIEAGVIDIFAWSEGDTCNGPRCIKCDRGFCHHCSNKRIPESIGDCPIETG
jgi:hypothetical protein